MTITGNFKRFQHFNFKTNFLENETFFKKLGYRFFVENTKIENASFSYKTAMAKDIVKTNKMLITKRIYHKELSFASNYFIFSFFVGSTTQMSIFLLFVSTGVLYEDVFFPVSVLN